MAESADIRRKAQREALARRIRAGYLAGRLEEAEKRQGSRSKPAPATPAVTTVEPQEELNEAQLRTVHHNRPGKGPGLATTKQPVPNPRPNPYPRIKRPQQKDTKTYQKHVLFALVTAFLLQLVANGVSLPTKVSS